jgi:hypothetical protein
LQLLKDLLFIVGFLALILELSLLLNDLIFKALVSHSRNTQLELSVVNLGLIFLRHFAAHVNAGTEILGERTLRSEAGNLSLKFDNSGTKMIKII